MKIIRIIKRYRFFIISLLILFILSPFSPNLLPNTLLSAKNNIFQMLSVLPPIMIMLGLMDQWVPRELLMKYMGDNSGIGGIALAFLIGSLAAGPMYAAFPFTAVLIKKGVKFSNVIIFMNAWCVTKISTLLFEISAIGYKFTLSRLIIDIPGIIIMGFLVSHFMTKEDLETLYSSYK